MTQQIVLAISKGNIEKETEKAICFDLGLGTVWFPKSLISIEWDMNEENASIRLGNLTMPYWLARKHGLTQKPTMSMAW